RWTNRQRDALYPLSGCGLGSPFGAAIGRALAIIISVAATVIAVTVIVMMVMEPQTVGDAWTGGITDYPAAEEAHGRGHEGTRRRAEHSVKCTLAGARCSRRQQHHSNDSRGKYLFHDCLQCGSRQCIRGPASSFRSSAALTSKSLIGSPPALVRLIKQPPACLKLRKRAFEPIEIFGRHAPGLRRDRKRSLTSLHCPRRCRNRRHGYGIRLSHGPVFGRELRRHWFVRFQFLGFILRFVGCMGIHGQRKL